MYNIKEKQKKFKEPRNFETLTRMDSNHHTSDSKSDICTLQTARQKYLKNFLHTDTGRFERPTRRLTGVGF